LDKAILALDARERCVIRDPQGEEFTPLDTIRMLDD